VSNAPAYIHHVNFPTTDPERTKEWYTKVFGLKAITPKSNTKVVLMTRGNFDLHFTPVETMDRMAPYHFAVEIEDWDGFMKHLEEVGVRHTRITSRPENRSLFCYIHDPDHTMIELVYHERRPGGAPEVVQYAEKSAARTPQDTNAEDARATLSEKEQVEAELEESR
jgi:lactoylglutathione lyase